MLHVVHGESAIQAMTQAGLPGGYLSWHDVLHDGPVPDDLNLDALSETRAQYIADVGWADVSYALDEMRVRNQTLRRAAGSEEIVIWTSAELFDHLMMLQVVDWFASHRTPKVFVVMVDGLLSELSPDQWRDALGDRDPLNEAQRAIGQRAWSAFRSSEPTQLQMLLAEDLSQLPMLHDALRRLAEMYPRTDTGLSRTERQILQAIQDGAQTPGEVFRANQAMEQPQFMGDWSFWLRVAELSGTDTPAVRTQDGATFRYPPQTPHEEFLSQRLELTELGEALLAGERDWLAVRPIDRWIGGVHLRPDRCWRYSPRTQSFELSR